MLKTSTSPKREAIRLTDLWQEHGPNEYPIDIDALIDGAIVKSGFPDQLVVEKRKFDNFEGSLVRTKGSRKWTILLNADVSNARRRRFTFAHELGHFMCHRELRDEFEDNESTLNDFIDKIEAEANVFASWLLMPANLLRLEFKDLAWETRTLQAIGNRFQCSLQASALRFVQLSARPIAFVVSRDGIIIWATKSETAPYMTSYCFGDELPKGSHALACHQNGEAGSEREAVGQVWSNQRLAFESQYFDYSGLGYQYTCIEFD